MKIKHAVICLAAMAAMQLPVNAQINSSRSVGYVERAAMMLRSGNYIGCLDQCDAALRTGSVDRERIAWMQCLAAFRGGYADAGRRVSAFLKRFPDSSHHEQAEFMKASLTFFAGNYDRAYKELKAIDGGALDTGEAETLDYRLAYSMMMLGNTDGALSLMSRLTATDRYGAAARFYEGYLHYLREDYDKALPILQQAESAAAPGNMAPYYLAQIYYKRSDYAKALDMARRVLGRADSDTQFADEAKRIAGESLYTLGRRSEGLVHLREYVSDHRDDAPPSTRYIVGMDLYESGDYQPAIDMLAPVAELNDAMGQSASFTIGQCYLSSGNASAAQLAFDKAARMDFDPSVTEMSYYNYAVARLSGSRVPFANSVKTLEEFISRYPDSRYASRVQNYLVKGYMATDDYEGALRSLNALSGSKAPELADARRQVNFVLGTRALSAGNVDAALKYLHDAEREPGRDPLIDRQTALWLGDAYYAKADYDKAKGYYRSYLDRADASDSNRTLARYNYGYSLFGLRDYAGARKQFQNVVSVASDVPQEMRVDSENRIADTYYYGSDFENALKSYRKAFDLNPAIGDYSLLQSAMMSGHMGRQSDKLDALDRLISSYPESSLHPVAMTEKAVTLASAGRTRDAIRIYESIADRYSANSYGRNAMLQLAILNDNAGDTPKAIEYYRGVVSRYPTSNEAELAVQDLKRIYAGQDDIEALNSFLTSIDGAPQLDETERSSIAAASLLRRARAASRPSERMDLARKLLDTYPDADGASEALLIAATAEYDMGLTDKALDHYVQLESRASDSAMRHKAQMGILRAARDMGHNELVISTSERITGSSAGADIDLQEVGFLRAASFSAMGQADEAERIWRDLAATPANIYGTRSAFELADSKYRAGNLVEAEKLASELIDANPPHAYWLARTFVLYSDILRARGNDFEANEYLRALRSNYPGNDADIFQLIDQRLPEK